MEEKVPAGSRRAAPPAPLSPKSPRVLAFVGPAGTGKSQRAQMVARENDVEFIIDDGLVISGGKIHAGKSAKSEKNLVRAIRRALFEYPDHRIAVTEFLRQKNPRNIMVVATSISMADKITRALSLPLPERIIDITEVASPDDILSARRERMEKGQHVIPVSRTQLRKNFAGKLVGHLRDLLKSMDRDEGERTIVRPPFSFFGSVTIHSSAIADLVRLVVASSPQTGGAKDIRVRSSDESVSLEITISVFPGKLNFLQVGSMHQRKVASAVSYFTGIDVDNVDITIGEIILP